MKTVVSKHIIQSDFIFLKDAVRQDRTKAQHGEYSEKFAEIEEFFNVRKIIFLSN